MAKGFTSKNFLQMGLTERTAWLLNTYIDLSGSKRSYVVERLIAHAFDGLDKAAWNKDKEALSKEVNRIFNVLKYPTFKEDQDDLKDLDVIVKEARALNPTGAQQYSEPEPSTSEAGINDILKDLV